MAREISTDIQIQAPAACVWHELVDFTAYPRWNPFIPSIAGARMPGGKLSVLLQLPNGKRMRFRPVIHRLKEHQCLVWRGHWLIPGLFDGEHSFELTAQGETLTRLVHKECFSGILVPMLWNSLEREVRQGFMHMNEALKKRCEENLLKKRCEENL